MERKKEIVEEYRQKDFLSTFDKTRAEYVFHKQKHIFETKIIHNAIKALEMNGSKKIRVLDVACGTGRLLSEIVNKPKIEYTGLDTSEEMFKLLRKKHPDKKINLVLADASKMPFENETFDLTFTYHLLWHLPLEEQKKIIGEMIRVTKKGGIVIFDALNSKFMWEKMKGVLRRKKDPEMYRLNIGDVKKWVYPHKFKVDKLLDPPTKNQVAFSMFNVLNKMNKTIPSSFFHMLFFTVRIK